MAPRLSKRQQRQQEELLALASSNLKPTPAAPSTDQHESADEESVAPTKTSFAALFTPEDEQAELEESENDTAKPAKSRKTKKKRKKTASSAHDEEGHQAVKPGASSSQSKPGTKKAKAKDKKEEKNDLDKALEELSIKYPDLQQIATSSSADTRATKLSTLFSVSVSHLDAESELKRFFGSKAVSAAQAATSSPKRRHGAQPQTQRSQLTRPQLSWGAIKQREGLSARPLTEEETNRKANKGPAGPGRWWTVEYSKRYKGVTKTFMQAVMTGDPDTLWRVLQRMPWHADTLLQLAEVYRHREEYGQAVDYVSRALYAYERAFLGAFTFTSGSNRLDFDRVENRPFFLAIHRQVIDLQRRGCPRTAFEHARLLLSLEPLLDPHGIYLHLDYLCVKTGLGDWLLDVWSVYQDTSDEDSGEYMDPSVLPGWAYARALILRAKEKGKKERGEDFKEESTEALRQAILEFPSIVPLLADKCEISLSAEVRGHKAFRIYTDRIRLSPEESILHLLSHLYVQRSAPLWKSSALASWLSNTSNSLLSTLSAKSKRPIRERFLRTFSSLNLRYSIYRHVFVLEQTHAQPQNRVLTAFIPPDIMQGRHLACDPLPTPSSLSTYDTAFFAGAEDPFAIGAGSRPRRRTQADERLLARLIPDAATRAQVVAIYDQNPWIAAQVPGGVVEFAQIIGEAPEDMLDELLAAAVMHEAEGAGGGGAAGVGAAVGAGALPALADRGAMPGQLFGEDENDVFWEANEGRGDAHDGHDDGDTEEEEDLEEVAPLPVRVLRGFFNRLWGGVPAQEDSSDDEDAHNE